MNQKRKAELQRKLSMMPVPRPPADLADRIKAGIPDDLAAVTGRSSRSAALRIAASILVVIASTAIMALYILGGRKSETPSSAPRAVATPVLAQPKWVPEAELTVSVAEAPRADAVAKPRPQVQMAEARQNEALAGRAKGALETREEQFAPTAVADAVRPAEAEKKLAEAAQPAEHEAVGAVVGGIAADRAAAEPAPPAALPAAPAVAQQTVMVSKDESAGRSPARVQAASKTTALVAAAPPPREMFGISIDPDALTRVQKTIESGHRPSAASVDVEAIVSYLAAEPESPSSGVSLDVEASREPELVNSRSAMIRFTIDTAPAPEKGRWIGYDAKLEIRLDPSAVASHRILGNGKLLTLQEPVLFDSTSVTGVIELTLAGGLPPHHDVATLKLRYRDANRHSQMIQRTVRVADLQRSWEMASFRHRLATLGAIWSESIRGGAAPAPAEVARTAEELASEAPRDTRARDLAAVANATSRLDGSGSSGGSR